MKKVFLAVLILSLVACSPPTPLEVVEADKPSQEPAHTAVTAYLKQTLDDPASYQPAHCGKPTA